MTEHLPVLIVGGGQAGLATGYELGRRGIHARILDANRSVGDVWRQRWDSLRLFTPAAYSSLPGLPFPAPADHHPTKDEVAEYLATYASTFELDVRPGVTVDAVTANGDRFHISTTTGTLTADAVVIATGPFQTPVIPAVADGLSPHVVQLHSDDYHRPDQLPDGRILVVGGGNSGCQIAEEVHAGGREVHLSVGARMPALPERVAGRELFRWLDAIGYLRIDATSRLGRRLRNRDTVIGTGPKQLRRLGIDVHGRLIDATDRHVVFAGMTAARVDAVVWATGFRRDHSFVSIPGALDHHGVLIQRGGRSPIDGLYTVGQPWQTSRGSALLGFVGVDAAAIAAHLDRRPSTAPCHPVNA